MKMAVIGAAGKLGSRIVAKVLRRVHRVTALTPASSAPLRLAEECVIHDQGKPVVDRAYPVRLSPSTMFDSTGLGFSPIVVSPPGSSLVFVSGQLASNQNLDFEHQVDQVFRALQAALDAVGATPQAVLRITCLVVDHDPQRRTVVSNARLRFFRGQGPASTIIPVPRLAEATALFEIDAIAIVHEPVSTA